MGNIVLQNKTLEGIICKITKITTTNLTVAETFDILKELAGEIEKLDYYIARLEAHLDV